MFPGFEAVLAVAGFFNNFMSDHGHFHAAFDHFYFFLCGLLLVLQELFQ